MSHAVWVRVSFLLVSAALLVAAIHERREASAGVGDFPGVQGSQLRGITGQRQVIDFHLDGEGRPAGFVTKLFSQCPTDSERPSTWTPSHNAPVPFVWHGNRLTVHESKSFDYGNGSIGIASGTLRATLARGRIEGSMRLKWRFAEHGKEYMVCDTGHIPFTAGDSFSDRLDQVRPVREPWTLYPARPASDRSLSPRHWLFARRVDDTCSRTWGELQDARKDAARRWRDSPNGRVLVEGVYVQYHAAQAQALVELGEPPSDRSTYAAWLGNFKQRVALERRQLGLLRRHDLDGAAALGARLATLKAEGQVVGIEFGLGACVSLGPEGSTTS